MTKQIRPPFAYFGGKQTLARRIVEHFPAHDHYVEPFAGGLAVLLAKPQSKMETLNDLDGELINFWRVLRDRPAELVAVCELTPHSRAEYQLAFDLESVDDLERARRVWVQLTQGRLGTRRRTGWRNHENPAGSFIGMPGYLKGYVTRMHPAADRLKHCSLEARPALDVIRAYGEHEDVLIYADPPYLGTTRSGRQYAVEMTAEAEHRELADTLNDCRCSVVLSGYRSWLYDGMFSAWRRVDFTAFTGQGNKYGARVECLWLNRRAVSEVAA